MKIFSAYVPITGESKIYKCEVTEYQGKLWIVADSFGDNVTGEIKLSRLILLENLRHQGKTEHPNLPVDFVINDPIPRCVFDGQVPPGTSFQILELPLITDEVPNDVKFH